MIASTESWPWLKAVTAWVLAATCCYCSYVWAPAARALAEEMRKDCLVGVEPEARAKK